MARTSNAGTVGILRVGLTVDSSQFDTSMRKAVDTTETTTTAIGGLTEQIKKLTPQAERMAKAFSGERLLASANNLVAAVQRVGGAQTLTEAQQRRVNATVTEAIEKYRALGKEAPQELIALELATRRVEQSTKGMNQAFKERVAAARGSLGGSQLLGEAVATTKAVAQIGGASKLTQAQQAQVNRMLTEAIEKYRALGKEAPQELIALELATRRVEQSTRGMNQAFKERVAAARGSLGGSQLLGEAVATTKAVAQIGGASKLTQAQQAQVNKMLTEAIAKYTALGKVAPQSMRDLEKATRGVIPPTENLGLSLSGIGKSILAWAAGFVTAQAALNIFQAAVHNTVEEIKTLTVEGAAVGDVTENFERLTAAAGQSGQTLLGILRQGTHNTIDDLTLMKLVNNDLAAGLRLTNEQWLTLARGGFALAQKDASDVATGLDKLNDALLTGNARAARQLVGRINQDAAEKRYKETIHKTGEELTDAGKLEAMRAALLDRTAAATNRLGEQTDGLDEKVAQTQTTWRNFQNELGRTVATSPVILAGFDALQEVLAKLVGGNKEDTIKNIGKAIDSLAIFFVEAAKIGVQSAGAIAKAWEGLKSTFSDLTQDLSTVRAQFLALQDVGKIISGTGDTKHAFADLLKQLTDVGVSMVDRAKDADTLAAHQQAIDKTTQQYIAILDKALVVMRAAQGAHSDVAGAIDKARKSLQGLRDDQDDLTTAGAKAQKQAEAFQEALEALTMSFKALSPEQQETIRLFDQAGVGADTIAKAMGLTTDEVNRSLKSIQLYGEQFSNLDDSMKAVMRSINGLTAEQKAQITTGVNAGLSIEEITKELNRLNPALHIGTLAVKEFAEGWSTVADDVRAVELQALEGFAKQLPKLLEEETNARNALAQTDFNKQQQIAAALAGIGERRAQSEIEMARIRGASIKDIATLERVQAQLTLNSVLSGIQAETRAREMEVQAIEDSIAAAKAAGVEITPEQERALAQAKANLEAQREIAQAQTQRAVEDFNLGERDKQAAIRRTTNVWIRAWDEMRSTSDSTIESVARGIADLEHQTAGKLGTILFGFRDENSRDLRRAAADAKQQFEELKRSGRATADDLKDAFDKWREAEAKANNTFAYRFKQVWLGIKSTLIDILNDLLKYFIEQFLAGMIRAIVASRLGEWIGRSLRIGLPAAAATSTAPWWLPAIPGIGGGNPPPAKAPPRTPPAPSGPGIVPLPPAAPGGPHVPTPPPIATASIDRLRQVIPTVKSFQFGGFTPPQAVDLAVVHGGRMGEWHIPGDKMPLGMPAQTVQVSQHHHWTINGIDGPSIQRLVRTPEFIREVRSAAKLNLHGFGSTLRFVTTGEP